MTENEEDKTDKSGSEDIAQDLNFAPSWARTAPEVHVQRFQNQGERYSDDNGRSGFRESGRDNQRERRNYRDQQDRQPRRSERRPPRREQERFADEKFSRPPQHERDEREHTGAAYTHEKGGHHGDRREAPQQRERPVLPIEIRILPEQKALGAVIRHIQTSNKAFPLRDIAELFLAKPASCLLRIETAKEQEQPIEMFQCKVCGMPTFAEEDIRTHLVNHHLDDFFEVEKVDCEPPAGAFVCVARCGLSGELLGPPNHHSFSSKVQEMLRTRYAGMPEEAYRARIEMVRDSDTIEKWRQQCTRKKIYRRRGAVATPVEPLVGSDNELPTDETEPMPKAPSMERDVAELVFMREILHSQVASARTLNCTAAVAIHTPSRQLLYAVRDAMNRERRFPTSLFFALRGAFRHRKLHLFKVNDARGSDFVMGRVPVALEMEHVVKDLQDILVYLQNNPGCTKSEFLKAMVPDGDEGKLRELLKHLVWLVERGNVIHYYNDVLGVPLDYPAFRFLPSEKSDGRFKPPTQTAKTELAQAEPAVEPAQAEPAVEPTVE